MLTDRFSAIFSRVKGDFAWQLSSLRDQLALEESFVSNVTSSLAKYLPTIIPPASFDFVFGHNALAEAFVNAYIAQLHSLGIQAKLLPPIFRSQISYATKATLPPLSSTFSQHPVRLATMPNDLEAVALMYKQFHRVFEEETDSKCREEMSIWILLGLVWICSVDGEPAGYVCAARPTPRTISIRNVFVKPEFRRKGVAETMVRAVSRYYLGADTVGFEGVPSSLPKEGVKEEICLNVIEEHIARLYRRCGYLLGEDDRDPATGRKGWIPTSFWTVDYSKE